MSSFIFWEIVICILICVLILGKIWPTLERAQSVPAALFSCLFSFLLFAFLPVSLIFWAAAGITYASGLEGRWAYFFVAVGLGLYWYFSAFVARFILRRWK